MVAYHFNANVIYGQPLKNRESATITSAWAIINKKFQVAGVQPDAYVIDNEASLQLKYSMQKEGIKYQLVPPHNHRANMSDNMGFLW